MTAYVLIQTEQGKLMADELGPLPGIVSAEDLSAAYDAIAVARSDADGLALDGILAEIRGLPRVTRALPAHVLNGDSGSRDEAA